MIVTARLSGVRHELRYDHAAVVMPIQIVMPVHIVADATLWMALHELILLYGTLSVLGATLFLIRIGGVHSRCAGQQKRERELSPCTRCSCCHPTLPDDPRL